MLWAESHIIVWLFDPRWPHSRRETTLVNTLGVHDAGKRCCLKPSLGLQKDWFARLDEGLERNRIPEPFFDQPG